jgi:hypothetical protein
LGDFVYDRLYFFVQSVVAEAEEAVADGLEPGGSFGVVFLRLGVFVLRPSSSTMRRAARQAKA